MTAAPEYEFSVIIPTHGRPLQLSQALAAVTRTTLAPDSYEVVVVADGCGQALDEALAVVPPEVQVALVEQDRDGPGGARNTGAARARGRYLAFTDDDCLPSPEWLETLRRALAAAPGALVGGLTVNALNDNAYSAASQLIHQIVYDHYNRDHERATFLASNNLAVCAERFREIGGFDRSFRIASEDRDFCDRWRLRGWPMRYEPRALVRHAHELSLARFCRQHFRYGRGAAAYHEARAARGSGRISDEFSFHANFRNWALRPLSEGGLARRLEVAALLLAWQGCNASGYLFERLRRTVGRPAS